MTDELHHFSWSPAQSDFIEKCIHKHGMITNADDQSFIEFKIKKISGLLCFSKGLHKFFNNEIIVRVYPNLEKVVFYNFNKKGSISTYSKGDVSYKNHNEVISSKSHHLKFKFIKRIMRWNLLDTIYFFGQALVTYYSVPNVLLRLELLEESIVSSRDTVLRGFTVRFPKSFITHCEVQSFYFDDNFLLYRHDYRANIIFPPAYGAHFTSNYEVIENIAIAKMRVVKWRVFKYVMPFTVLRVNIIT